MIKMELNEVMILLALIEQSSFKGVDIPTIAVLIEKLQKEQIKLQPQG